MRNFRSFILFIAFVFFSFWVNGQSYTISGNTLTTKDNVQITVGSFIRYVKPYHNNTNFTSIFSEITLRSTSEENLPKGIAADQGGKEVKVRKFYERKMGKSTRVFVIVGNGLFNQAIDIDNALNNGEVLVQRPASELANTTAKPNPPKSGTSPLRFPWQKAPVVPIDSSKWITQRQKKADSLNSLLKSNKKDSIVAKPVVKINPVIETPVVTKTPPTSIILPNTNSPSLVESAPAPVKTESVTSVPNPNKELGPSSGPTSSVPMVNVPVAESAPVPTVPESAHSVSSLLTLHPIETPKSPNNDSSSSKENKGYEKYNKLKQLKELYDQGILNKDEFEAEKKKILSSN